MDLMRQAHLVPMVIAIMGGVPWSGMPVRRQPLRGSPREARDFGQVVTAPIRQLQTPLWDDVPGADRALDSAEHLRHLAVTGATARTRVPAPLTEAHTRSEQAIPGAVLPLRDGYRDQAHAVTYGSVPPRGGPPDSAPRPPQPQ